MNQNDMDRYFWRTGHRWSGDNRHLGESPGPKVTLRTMLLLTAAVAVTTVLLLLGR